MSIEQDPDLAEGEDYDEEADSDFHDGPNEEDAFSSSEESDEPNIAVTVKSQNRVKSSQQEAQKAHPLKLDSGDEATIKEQKKTRRRQKRKGEDVDSDTENEQAGWRAKTRAMREREKDERKQSKLVNIESSTIDVDKIWEEMNRPGPLPPIRIEGAQSSAPAPTVKGNDPHENKENILALKNEEMITIKRKFKFAGEVHTEEKVVPKSSAEARLWLAQQDAKAQPLDNSGSAVQRPIRKVSRFDPNYNNLDAFKTNWSNKLGTVEPFKGPKLNVIEKSKMDWASHVDTEGLKDELDEHAKAKDGYHSRMDFLSQVEQRQEEETRQARMKR